MNSQNSAESDEDDPVVKEIPIIHSKKLEQSLHLFQFPLKRKTCMNEQNIRKCYFKPLNQEVKLEMSINMDSPNFDIARAKNIAEEVDGAGNTPKIPKYFENGIVDKVFLESSVVVEEPHKYAAAVYNGKEIHLTSLKGIFQFRPTFPYMEKGSKKKKDSEGTHGSQEEAGPSSAKQVTVKFKSNDEGYRKKQDASYQSLKAQSEQEPWIECDWYESNSTLSSVERLKLISDNISNAGHAMNLSKLEYTKLLIPQDQEKVPLEPTLPSNVLSLRALKQLPLVEQCRLLLKDAQIIQFQQLFMVLTGGGGEKFTADSLLKVLPSVAVLVRGNWVVKSEVLYPPDTFSATSGVPAELMCRARDYILYLFTKNQSVDRNKASSVLKVPSDEIKDIFTGVSKLRRHHREWELKSPDDHEFLGRHADLAQKQTVQWEHRFRQLGEFLKEGGGRGRRKSRSESRGAAGEEGRGRSGGPAVGSDNDSGTEKNKSPPVGPKTKRGKVNRTKADGNS